MTLHLTSTFADLDRILEQLQPPSMVDPEQCWAAVQRHAGDLKIEAERIMLPWGYAGEKLYELRHHLGMRLGKEPEDGHPIDQHWRWAVQALNVLRSAHCFGPALDREARGAHHGKGSKSLQ